MSPMNNRLLRPRASGFNPLSISGMAGWWDASVSSSVTIATGVSSWVDLIAAEYKAAVAEAIQ